MFLVWRTLFDRNKFNLHVLGKSDYWKGRFKLNFYRWMVNRDMSEGFIEWSNEREKQKKKHIVSNKKMKNEIVFIYIMYHADWTVQPFGHIMSGRFMSGSEGAVARIWFSYVKINWHGYCNRYYIQLCKEVLARLLQRPELRMIIKINKKMRMKIKINKKMIMKIILNNLRARQNDNDYQSQYVFW